LRRLLPALLLLGCEPRDFTSEELAVLRTLTDLGDPPLDRSNQWVGDERAVALGKRLYFDRGFSGSSSGVDVADRTVPFARTSTGTPVNLSCADCHDPARGGADHSSEPNEFSIGAGWFNVNAPSVINAAYWDLFFWNGRGDNLWSVSIAASEAKVAYNSDRLAILWRLHTYYRAEYEAIFGPLPIDPGAPLGGDSRFPLHGKPGKTGCDPGLGTEPYLDVFDCMPEEDRDQVNTALVRYAKAIAAYETTLVIQSSPFDEYLDGAATLSDEAIRGAKLFIGKAACIECHHGPLFSDGDFHNTGVPETELARPKEAECTHAKCDCTDPDSKSCAPWGALDGLRKLPDNPWLRTSKHSDDPTDDSRAHHLTRELTDDLRGAWRTPSLRNLAQTAPFMHNGAYRTLEEVIWHYDQGGTSSGAASEYKSPVMQALHLDERDVRDLVAFLDALNGEPLPEELTTP
jgi:cytochrome c peroxidase